MELNWAERFAVNNPVRVLLQRLEIRWMKKWGLLAQPGARILEIGCGRGAGAALILQYFRPAAFQAMDLDRQMVRKAKRRLAGPRTAKIACFVGDAVNLPYRGASLDAIFGFGVLHHLPDWRGGIREIARVLKPGGLYFLEEIYPALYQNFLIRRIFHHPPENRFQSGDLKEAIRKMNFIILQSQEIAPFWILAVLQKGSRSPNDYG